jgi:hypothetical protein
MKITKLQRNKEEKKKLAFTLLLLETEGVNALFLILNILTAKSKP